MLTEPGSANSTYAYLITSEREQRVMSEPTMGRDTLLVLPLGVSGELVAEDRYSVDGTTALEMLL